MNHRKLVALGSVVTVALAALVGAIAMAGPSHDHKHGDEPEMKLPPGWTEADMQACTIAGTPGKMHEHLAKGVGVWDCKTTMWMAPDTEPMTSGGTCTLTSVMDGRYTKCVIEGEMPGMGPYNCLGFYGYDNVSEKFVATFIDNHSTGIMNGVGELSADGKKLTWKYNYNCPITKKPAVLREIETITGENARTLEAFGTDPKSGKEFKMMSIEMTRK